MAMLRRQALRKSKGSTKEWLITAPGSDDFLEVTSEVLTVTEGGALVFSLRDGTIEWAMPSGSWLRVQSASYRSG